SGGPARTPDRPRVLAVDDGVSRQSPPLGQVGGADDDGANPLPPALAPEEAMPARSGGRTYTSPVSMAGGGTGTSRARGRNRLTAPVAIDPEALSGDRPVLGSPGSAQQPGGEEPQPIPEGVLPSARRVTSASAGSKSDGGALDNG